MFDIERLRGTRIDNKSLKIFLSLMNPLEFSLFLSCLLLLMSTPQSTEQCMCLADCRCQMGEACTFVHAQEDADAAGGSAVAEVRFPLLSSSSVHNSERYLDNIEAASRTNFYLTSSGAGLGYTGRWAWGQRAHGRHSCDNVINTNQWGVYVSSQHQLKRTHATSAQGRHHWINGPIMVLIVETI